MYRDIDSGKRFSIKYDGSPSLIMGEDPADGKFFLATKSLFNKTPVYYKSRYDLHRIPKRQLCEDLEHVWDAYSGLKFDGEIYQGDLLWTPRHKDKLFGMATFRTNVLTYVVNPIGFEPVLLTQMIDTSEVGVAFHTEYKGESLTSLRVVENDVVLPPSSVRAFSLHCGLAGSKSDVPPAISSPPTGPNIEVDPEVVPHLKRFFVDPQQAIIPNLLSRISEHYYREGEDRKSARGKLNVQAEYNRVVNWIRANASGIEALYQYYLDIVAYKKQLIDVLEERCWFMCYYQEGERLIPTQQEGFVYNTGTSLVKLVDRQTFTKINSLNSPNR